MLVSPIASSDKAESFRFFFCLETFTELGQLMISAVTAGACEVLHKPRSTDSLIRLSRPFHARGVAERVTDLGVGAE